MEEALINLNAQEEALTQQLKERLTDLGEKVVYKRLYEVMQTKNSIYKQLLEQSKNGH